MTRGLIRRALAGGARLRRGLSEPVLTQVQFQSEGDKLFTATRLPLNEGTLPVEGGWLRSFHAPLAIRVERRGARVELLGVVRSNTGRPQYPLWQTRLDITEDWPRLRPLLDSLGTPLAEDMETRGAGHDGSKWLFEACRGGEWRGIDRWTPQPGHPFYEAGKLLVALARIDAPPARVQDFY